MVLQRVLSVADFDFILDNYAGRQLTHTPVTKTGSNYTGEEILVEGTPVSIKCYVMKTAQNFNFKEHGFLEKGDMVGLFKIADNVTLNSIITVDGEDFRVKESYNVPGIFDSTGSGSINVYTAATLFLKSD